MESIILKEARDLAPELIKHRRTLHKTPEIGIKLPNTVKYVDEQLSLMGVDHVVYEDISCILATIGSGEKCILLRGDMDALPGTEISGEEFSSENGCMHACGHDMHAAALLGAAALLKKHEAELKGTVKLFFQSGEETFQGAKAAIEKGILENPKVERAYGMHVFSQPELGELQYGDIAMASVYGFKITVKGSGGHGSQPENCIDPINAAVCIYQAFQTLVARELPAKEEAVLTIGHFEAGKAANVIPDTAVLEGTLRTFKPEIRAMMMRRIGEIANSVAIANRCSVEIETLSDVPSNISDPKITEECLESVRSLGEERIETPGLHLMGSEDFACIAELVPSAYFVLGAGVEKPEERYPQHNPRIRFNEKALSEGAAIYAKIALDYLK